MRRLTLAPVVTSLVLASLVLASGCAQRRETETLRQQLAACEQARAVATARADAAESSLESERRRWDAIETELKTTLPETVRGFEEERARLIAVVPDEVKREVGERFDRYVARMTKEFQTIHSELEGLRGDMKTANVSLGDIKTTTTRIDTNVDRHGTDLSSQLVEHGRVAERVVAEIIEFDRKHVNCEKCTDGVRIKGKPREVLARFHGQLIADIQAMGTLKR